MSRFLTAFPHFFFHVPILPVQQMARFLGASPHFFFLAYHAPAVHAVRLTP